MLQNIDQPVVISASRTKDMVHRCPVLLADLLSGEKPCRWGPHGPFGTVEPESVHSVVLWTKDPRPILQVARLNRTLTVLKEQFSVQIALQITATGLGESFVEPGIPSWETVLITLRDIFASGLVSPAGVVYRFDPFLRVKSPEGRFLSNASLKLFSELCAAFTALGIRRVTTSRADAIRYPKVLQRVRDLGLEWVDIDDDEATRLCLGMDEICRSYGAEFSVCCEPQIPGITNRWGCIDGAWLNRNKPDQPQTTEVLHNKIGRQRPVCRCTYSRDIGYSPGSLTCFSGGFGCLYCYSQGNAILREPGELKADIARFDCDPVAYLKEKGLSPELLIESPG